MIKQTTPVKAENPDSVSPFVGEDGERSAFRIELELVFVDSMDAIG